MFTAREYGAALLGNACLCWLARNSTGSVATKAIIVALFVYDLIGCVMTALTIFFGILNALGWLIVLIYLFFTVGFGYFLIKPISEQEK